MIRSHVQRSCQIADMMHSVIQLCGGSNRLGDVNFRGVGFVRQSAALGFMGVPGTVMESLRNMERLRRLHGREL